MQHRSGCPDRCVFTLSSLCIVLGVQADVLFRLTREDPPVNPPASCIVLGAQTDVDSPRAPVHVLGVQAAVLFRLTCEDPLVNSFDYGRYVYLFIIDL